MRPCLSFQGCHFELLACFHLNLDYHRVFNLIIPFIKTSDLPCTNATTTDKHILIMSITYHDTKRIMTMLKIASNIISARQKKKVENLKNICHLCTYLAKLYILYNH